MSKRGFGAIGWGRVAAMAVVVLLLHTQAWAWWNDNWQYRQKIGFDTTATGGDIRGNLADVPVLVRLHTGNFIFEQAGDRGDDIRFVSANDQQLLKHHIEKFDPIDEIAYIWVRLPRLSGNSSQEFIWMYYGNRQAAGGQDHAGTYDDRMVAVYHLDELEGAPLDATAHKHHAAWFQGGQGLPSVIGNGITFSGGGDRLVLPTAPDLSFTAGFTFSTWVRIRQPQSQAVLLSRLDGEGRGVSIRINGTAVCFQITTDDGQVHRTEECLDLSLETWHHLAFTAQSGDRMSAYLDGLATFYMNLPAPLPAVADPVHIGAAADGSGAFFGDLDEIQFSDVSRSADWIRAAFKAQGVENPLLAVGPQETGDGGMPIFYLGTVLRNITLEGWLIIFSLVVLGILSWVVFISKTVMVYLGQKENKAFKAIYQANPDPLCYDRDGNRFGNSSLYRIFASGCDALRHGLSKNGAEAGTCADPDLLGARGKSAIKAALERGFIEESQRLNAYLAIMVMGISGGPFLGLLGTVWGVMNTFAAMADSGEASIMAIAPGVASALATTVFGLIVAIPALFGYNYLTGKIKDVTAEMMILVDQFNVNVEELYGAGR